MRQLVTKQGIIECRNSALRGEKEQGHQKECKPGNGRHGSLSVKDGVQQSYPSWFLAVPTVLWGPEVVYANFSRDPGALWGLNASDFALTDQFPDEALLRPTDKFFNLLYLVSVIHCLDLARTGRKGGLGQCRERYNDAEMCWDQKPVRGECSALEEVHSQLSSFSWL